MDGAFFISTKKPRHRVSAFRPCWCLFSYLNKKLVISTEAVHGLIVISAVERPPHFVFAVAFVFLVAIHEGDLLLSCLCGCLFFCRQPEAIRSHESNLPL